MKKIFLLVLLLCIFSCQTIYKNKCANYWDNLNYLKNYSIKKKDSTYLIKEVSEKIEYLESKTGIKAINQGDWLGRHEVKMEDIKAWEEWIKNNCK